MSEISRYTRTELTKAGIIPEAQNTFLDIQKWLETHPKETLTDYGHGVGMLGAAIVIGENKSHGTQREALKVAAQSLVEKYGERIKDVMRPELLEALGYK